MGNRISCDGWASIAILMVTVVALSVLALRQTSNSTYSCPTLAVTSQTNTGAYSLSVAYGGPWNSTVTEYKSFDRSLPLLTCQYKTAGSAQILFSDLNPNGESSVWVSVQKADAGNGNLTASLTYGAAVRANSTTSSFGMITVYEGVAP